MEPHALVGCHSLTPQLLPTWYYNRSYFATWKHRGRSEPHLLPPRLRPHAPGGAGEVPFGDVVLKMGDALLAGGSERVLTCSRAVCVSRWCVLCCVGDVVLKMGDALLAGGSGCVLACDRTVCVSRWVVWAMLP